jgi:NTF2-related export protein 1/2
MTCSLSIAILYQVCFATTPLHSNCLYFSLITGSQPPSLLVTVSGNVQHGRGPAGNPAATPAKSVDGQSRVFSQTFMLVPDPTAPPTKTGEVAKYYVNADAMRFVG